jgi:hypothetical protein
MKIFLSGLPLFPIAREAISDKTPLSHSKDGGMTRIGAGVI